MALTREQIAVLRGAAQGKPVGRSQEGGFKLTDLLPTAGGIIGGIGGSFLAPGIGTIGGGAAGSALGESLRQKIEGEDTDIGKIGVEGLFGAIPGGVGKVGKAGKAIAGRGLAKFGEDLAIKSIKPTPSQLFKFQSKHGEDILSALKKYPKLVGADADTIFEKGIKPLQQSFDDIAKTSGLKVDKKTLTSIFNREADDLIRSTDPDEQLLGKKLLQYKNSILKKYFTKGGKVDVSTITKERQLYDSKVKDFAVDPIRAGEKRLTANALREAIQETAEKAGVKGIGGKSLREIGIELSKLNDIQQIALKQANLGRGSNPLNLTSLLGAGAGGAVGNIPGAIAGAGIASAVNSPLARRVGSRALTGLGGRLQGEGTDTIGRVAMGQLIGQPLTRSLAGGLSGGEDPQGLMPEGQELMGMESQMLPQEAPQQSGFTNEALAQLLLMDMQETGGKNFQELKMIGELLMGGKEKPLTIDQKKAKSYGNRAAQANQIFDQLESDLGDKLTSRFSFDRRYPDRFKSDAVKRQEQAERNFINAILRRESGANIAPSEYESANLQYFPQPGDSPQLLIQKRLNRLQSQQNLFDEASPSGGQDDSLGALLSQLGGQF